MWEVGAPFFVLRKYLRITPLSHSHAFCSLCLSHGLDQHGQTLSHDAPSLDHHSPSGVQHCAPLVLSLSPLLFFFFFFFFTVRHPRLKPQPQFVAVGHHHYEQCRILVSPLPISSLRKKLGFVISLVYGFRMVGLFWNFFVFLGLNFMGLVGGWWVWWCKWVWSVIGGFEGVSGFNRWG